jgi:hypothetical protein
MDHRTEDALAHFVAELLDTAVPLAAALDHMHRWREAGRSAPDAPPPAATLGMLLHGMLGDIGCRHGAAELDLVTRVLHEARETICDELLLVPLDDAPACVPGRRRARRR